jgi:hypothetical protein
MGLSRGRANLGDLLGGVLIKSHIPASISSAAQLLGTVLQASQLEIRLAQQLQIRRQRGWSSLLKTFFYIGVIS